MKNINCTIEYPVNYLWHMFVLGNIWDKGSNPYVEKYGKTLTEHDKQLIYHNRELIAWGNGRCGALTDYFFFEPVQEARDLFWLKEYLFKLEGLLYDMSMEDLSYDHAYLLDKKDEIVKIVKIFRSYFDLYNETVWQDVQKELLVSKNRIEQHFNQIEVINKWEQFFQAEFPANSFDIVLSLANSNAPSANNLSKSRNNFFHSPEKPESMYSLVIHEVGVFMMVEELYATLSSPDMNLDTIKNQNLVYQAFESFAEYCKGMIFNSIDYWEQNMFGGGTMNMKSFIDFYKKEIPKGCRLDQIADILKKAVQNEL